MLNRNKNTEMKIEEKKTAGQELKEWGKVIIFSLLIALLVTSVVKPTLVVGQSMDNTLHDKDYLLVNRLAYTGDSIPQYKDIIVFHTDLPGQKVLIKRVIGVEGDKVRIENGDVYINDELLNEGYIGGQDTIGNVDTVVPKGKVFAMGDNRNNSLDSRFKEVGLVDNNEIIGKILFRVFPFDKIEE